MDAVREGIAAVTREDWPGLRELIAEDCEVRDYDIPDGHVYRGPDGFVEWLANWASAWETWSMRDLRVRDVGDERVLATFCLVAKGKGSGIELARDDAVVYTLRQGKILRAEYYNDQQQALRAVELRE